MPKTYLFYDIETSGLNKCFDQVLQFAAIRTDSELNEIERHELLIKLNPDTIPSPKATTTHRISPKATLNGIAEFEAIKYIHQLMNTPGTISLGYNTLGFDDEFLRFSFYRNLLPPYTHQYANQCSRMDLYPMAVAYYLYKNHILNWPINNNKISLKLEHLNAANQLATGMAHDAMSDVEATLALARILAKEKEMWNYLCCSFDKATDLSRIAKFNVYLNGEDEQHRLAILIDGQMGADAFFQCPVLLLGQHNHYKNQTLWLRLDREELSTTTADSIAKTTWVIHKKAGEPGILLPAEDRYVKHTNDVKRQLIENNKQWLQNNRPLLKQIIHYYKDYTYSKVPNLDVDAALYDNGFLNDYDQQLCQKFHTTEVSEKHKILAEFSHPSLKSMAIRILGRHYTNHLSAQHNDEFKLYMQAIKTSNEQEILVDYRGQKRLTAKIALEEIKLLRVSETLDEQQQNLLDELETYITVNFINN